MAPLQLFLGVKSCACEIERQITMAGARAWAGATQTPRSSTLVPWLPLFPHKALVLSGEDKGGFWDGSWLLRRGTQSCKPGESDKWFMLGRLAKGWTHQSMGFLETQLLGPSILEELSTALPEAAEQQWYTEKENLFVFVKASFFSIAGKWGQRKWACFHCRCVSLSLTIPTTLSPDGAASQFSSLKSFEKCYMSHLASLLQYLPAQCAYWDSSLTGLHCHSTIFT